MNTVRLARWTNIVFVFFGPSVQLNRWTISLLFANYTFSQTRFYPWKKNSFYLKIHACHFHFELKFMPHLCCVHFSNDYRAKPTKYLLYKVKFAIILTAAPFLFRTFKKKSSFQSNEKKKTYPINSPLHFYAYWFFFFWDSCQLFHFILAYISTLSYLISFS